MKPLSINDILKIWETGQGMHPIDRALNILFTSCPDMTFDQLAKMSIIQRDKMLLEIWESTFGNKLHGFVVCPHCKEDFEFSILTDEIIKDRELNLVDTNGSIKLKEGGIYLHIRLPNSIDIASVVDCKDVREARNLLIERCVKEVSLEGVPLSDKALTEEMIDVIAKLVTEYAPQADLIVELICMSCGHQWQLVLDIAIFLWIEISAYAKRLLEQVHLLARAYGWREADILSMNPMRREFYLEMVK